MIQQFILLGEGYNDLYELLELAQSNQSRVHMLLRLDTTYQQKNKSSLVLILNPASPGKMMPLYICLEGIPSPDDVPSKRYDLFEQLSGQLDIPIHQLKVKSSQNFEDLNLYYQYLIGVLRMNRYIPPLQ
ncbi:methylthioribose kinase [Alkalihalobacillus sp. MEB130]|uniref:DUF7147 family protein n=1 Tax=Alkalihalobacillus sp. MEB130 TaxID=2976704 RepID=UPI0028DDE47D|nr:methylthioribose kinase [Alkalihalobacillus sp. MEB130]MDT8859144.1 methylthioribose kinase [Alkalihalobacillus sp. MEB130]